MDRHLVAIVAARCLFVSGGTTDNGPIIIDWSTAAVGDPAADVARTLLILTYASLPAGLPAHMAAAIQALREQLCSHYLDAYCSLTNINVQHIDAWMLPVAAARLVENLPEDEKQRLLQLIERLLNDHSVSRKI